MSRNVVDRCDGSWLDKSVPETTTHTPVGGERKVTMTSTISVSLIAADEASAVDRVGRTLAKLEGFEPTGRVAVKSARHALYTVEVNNLGGDVNDAWVVLTSYGISPADDLGSSWQKVPGVGC